MGHNIEQRQNFLKTIPIVSTATKAPIQSNQQKFKENLFALFTHTHKYIQPTANKMEKEDQKPQSEFVHIKS